MNNLFTLLNKIDMSSPNWIKPLIVTLGIEGLYSSLITDSSHWVVKIFWMSVSYTLLHFIGRILNKKFPKDFNNDKSSK